MNAIEDMVSRIHHSPLRAVVAVSGAGSRAVAWLLGVGGASRTILEAVVPYGHKSMADFLGFEPAQFVSPETARAMARTAYRRGLRLREGNSPVVGVGCTATIATDRPKLGPHRGHVAAWDGSHCASYDVRLAKGLRDRAGEEEIVSRLVVHALATACGVDSELPSGLTGDDDLSIRVEAHPHPLERLLSGDVRTVTVAPDGRMEVDGAFHGGVLPGSFSPLHHGHEALARAAARILGADVVFELSVTNVDKPPLAGAEVRRRLAQFGGKATVALTRAETFRKKADLFPGCTFVIGFDTAERLVAPRYYTGGETALLRTLAEMWAAGCRFLVAGREDGGTFRTLAEAPVPAGFGPMFQGIPEAVFRVDISSTSLRSQT